MKLEDYKRHYDVYSSLSCCMRDIIHTHILDLGFEQVFYPKELMLDITPSFSKGGNPSDGSLIVIVRSDDMKQFEVYSSLSYDMLRCLCSFMLNMGYEFYVEDERRLSIYHETLKIDQPSDGKLTLIKRND